MRALALAAALALPGAAQTARHAPKELSDAVAKERYSQALRVFSAAKDPGGEEEYLAGFSLLRLHRPVEAAPHLRRAGERGFAGWPGWLTAEAMLDQTKALARLAPPPYPASAPAVSVFAGPATAWSAPVLEAVPRFEAVGRRIFGEGLPRLSFYVFAARPAYDRFFKTMFLGSEPTAWQEGTGDVNVVVFCEQDRRGKVTREVGHPDTVRVVLHEFGHAWLRSYLMGRYDLVWRKPGGWSPWLDEGLADYVAAMDEPAFLERRKAWVKDLKAGKGPRPPTFDELSSEDGFFARGDIEAHYWLAALLVADLLGPEGAAKIPKLLDEIARTRDAEEAVHAVTGQHPREAYGRLLSRTWPVPAR